MVQPSVELRVISCEKVLNHNFFNPSPVSFISTPRTRSPHKRTISSTSITRIPVPVGTRPKSIYGTIGNSGNKALKIYKDPVGSGGFKLDPPSIVSPSPSPPFPVITLGEDAYTRLTSPGKVRQPVKVAPPTFSNDKENRSPQGQSIFPKRSPAKSTPAASTMLSLTPQKVNKLSKSPKRNKSPSKNGFTIKKDLPELPIHSSLRPTSLDCE